MVLEIQRGWPGHYDLRIAKMETPGGYSKAVQLNESGVSRAVFWCLFLSQIGICMMSESFPIILQSFTLSSRGFLRAALVSKRPKYVPIWCSFLQKCVFYAAVIVRSQLRKLYLFLCLFFHRFWSASWPVNRCVDFLETGLFYGASVCKKGCV